MLNAIARFENVSEYDGLVHNGDLSYACGHVTPSLIESGLMCLDTAGCNPPSSSMRLSLSAGVRFNTETCRYMRVVVGKGGSTKNGARSRSPSRRRFHTWRPKATTSTTTPTRSFPHASSVQAGPVCLTTLSLPFQPTICSRAPMGCMLLFAPYRRGVGGAWGGGGGGGGGGGVKDTSATSQFGHLLLLRSADARSADDVTAPEGRRPIRK